MYAYALLLCQCFSLFLFSLSFPVLNRCNILKTITSVQNRRKLHFHGLSEGEHFIHITEAARSSYTLPGMECVTGTIRTRHSVFTRVSRPFHWHVLLSFVTGVTGFS